MFDAASPSRLFSIDKNAWVEMLDADP